MASVIGIALKPTPGEYCRNLLQKLYLNAIRGDGTDLEVTVPVSESGETKTFHLHHTIAAASSKYFATFPTPSSRAINEIDAVGFGICVKFVYLGHCNRLHNIRCELQLTRENVAAVFHCADFLQIDALTAECIEFLDHILDHSNYEQVVELAEKFNCNALKESALRFQSESSARNELLSKQKSLVGKITTVAEDCGRASKRYQSLLNKLKTTEEQLEACFKKEHDRVLSSKWMKNLSYNNDGDDIPNSMGNFHKLGAVGHLVLTSRRYQYTSSAYHGDYNGAFELGFMTRRKPTPC
jgi:hypothetical protein